MMKQITRNPVLVRAKRMLSRLRALGVDVDGPGYHLLRPFERPLDRPAFNHDETNRH